MQTNKKFNSAVAILQKIIQEQGEKILDKPNIVKGYMWDYKGIYTRNNDEKYYGKWVQEVTDALEIQAAESLQNSSSENISQTKKRLVLQLRNRYYVEEEFAIEAIDLICSALNISEIEPSEQYQNESDQKSAYELNQWGNHYFYGEGVPKDYDKAFTCYKQSADMGFAPAQNALGICYCNGRGTAQSWTEAASCFKDAADQDYAVAQCNLGNCYYYGNGVEKNRFEAVQWFKKAADQDYAAAQNKLGECYRDGEGIKKDYDQAEICFQKAADQNLAVAQRNLQDLRKNKQQKPQQQPQQQPQQRPQQQSQQRLQQQPQQRPQQEAKQEPKQDSQPGSHMTQNDNEEEKAQLSDAEIYYYRMLQKGFSITDAFDFVSDGRLLRSLEIMTPWHAHGHPVQVSSALEYKGMEISFIHYEELILGDIDIDITKRLNKRKVFLYDKNTVEMVKIDDANAIITEMMKKTCNLPYVQTLDNYMEVGEYRAKMEGKPTPSKQSYLNSYLPKMEKIIRDQTSVIIGSDTTLSDLAVLRSIAEDDT